MGMQENEMKAWKKILPLNMALVSRIEAVKVCTAGGSVKAGWIKILDQL